MFDKINHFEEHYFNYFKFLDEIKLKSMKTVGITHAVILAENVKFSCKELSVKVMWPKSKQPHISESFYKSGRILCLLKGKNVLSILAVFSPSKAAYFC